MLRRISGLLLVGIVVALVAAACGDDDPTPTPVVIEKEVIKEVEKEVIREVIVEVTPTPTSAPTPTATLDPATLTHDFLAFIPTQAAPGLFLPGFAEMVSTGTDDRITITIRDAPLAAEVINYMRRRPEDAGRLMWISGEVVTQLAPVGIDVTGAGVPPFLPQALWNTFPIARTHLLTIDPNIKTVQDLAGKRVHFGRPGQTWVAVAEIIFNAAGIRDQITAIGGGGKEGFDQMADGEVDATVAADHPGAMSGPQVHQIARTSGMLGLIGFDLALIEEMQAQNPILTDQGLLKPLNAGQGNLVAAARVDYNIIRENTNCLGFGTPYLAVTSEASEEVVYQMTKAVIENQDLADEFFPFFAPLWKDRMPHSFTPQNLYHAGARRAFDEAGVLYGFEGVEEWEAAMMMQEEG